MKGINQTVRVLIGLLNATTRDLEYNLIKEDRERKIKEIAALSEAVVVLARRGF